jgi:hypothetical protein
MPADYENTANRRRRRLASFVYVRLDLLIVSFEFVVCDVYAEIRFHVIFRETVYFMKSKIKLNQF